MKFLLLYFVHIKTFQILRSKETTRSEISERAESNVERRGMNRREKRNGINPSTNETLTPLSINRIIHASRRTSPSSPSHNRSSLWRGFVWRFFVVFAFPIFPIWILPSIIPPSALFFANAHPMNRLDF